VRGVVEADCGPSPSLRHLPPHRYGRWATCAPLWSAMRSYAKNRSPSLGRHHASSLNLRRKRGPVLLVGAHRGASGLGGRPATDEAPYALCLSDEEGPGARGPRHG